MTEQTMGCIECRNGVQRTYVLRYKFEKTDGGKAGSRRPKQTNDCTVRALALATELGYDAAYDLMAEAGRKCSRRFHFKKLANTGKANGYQFRWHSFPAIKGQSRMNLATFCESHPQGRWVVRVAKHVAAVIDGVYYDSFAERPDRCVYGAWEVIR